MSLRTQQDRYLQEKQSLRNQYKRRHEIRTEITYKNFRAISSTIKLVETLNYAQNKREHPDD